MKGTLHKTESGWHVINMQATLNGPLLQSLPILDHGYVNGPGLSDSDEGQEVEFRVIEFPVPPTNRLVSNSISTYAQLIGQFPQYPTKSQQLQIKIAEECFKRYPNNELLYPTDDLKDAYKAGVIDGLKEWTLDSYDRPKYPEVKIICPRCKALMPCTCKTTRYILKSKTMKSIAKEFIINLNKKVPNPPKIHWLFGKESSYSDTIIVPMQQAANRMLEHIKTDLYQITDRPDLTDAEMLDEIVNYLRELNPKS